MTECPSDLCHRPHQVTRWCWWSNAGDKRLKIKLWTYFTHVFKKTETTVSWNCISKGKALHFLQITAKHQDCPIFTVIFLTINTFIPKYLDNALMDFALTSRTSTRLLEERKKSSQCREIRLHVKYDVISMPRQLRCHYNPDQNEFSSLSNTDVVIIFPNLC